MDSNSFKQALLDLYDIYNPSKKKDVERIVSTYNGKEYDALKTVILRYNFKGHPGYSENSNRDEYIDYIIKNYSEGNRVISKENLLKQSQSEEFEKTKIQDAQEKEKEEIIENEKKSLVELGENVKEQIKKEIKELTKNVDASIENKTKKINDYFSSMKTLHSDVLNHSGQTIVNEIIRTETLHTKINIENLNFTDSDIKLPSDEILENVSKGTRLILKNSEGRVCGVEVKDITYDFISFENEVIKEIILEKI